ncbi:response regulator [Halalkalibacter sp. AB-rgal2]|uniref:response regulator transcription factor n=1 Tax=Halalkalibacter sp. AB-rgal2 TaxID=3242695 RepID=UPI00359D19C9
MINVLIVEDDKLVRSSLISTFNWEKYDMHIVNDAKNGEKALEVLEQESVDLIITDLAMPIMSGIELIRVVTKKYPRIAIVVLSLHRDFEYIQEAMRLGAIDYIAKVELDEENMDESLNRIRNRIKSKSHTSKYYVEESIDNGYVLLTDHAFDCHNILKGVLDSQHMNVANENCLIIKTNRFSVELLVDTLIKYHQNIGPLLCITSNGNKDKIEINKLIDHYEQLIFYELESDYKVAIKNIDQILLPERISKEQLGKWKKQIHSLEWITNELELTNLLQMIKNARLNKSQLEDVLLWTINKCTRMFYEQLSFEIQMPDEFAHWKEVEKWFYEVKQKIYLETYCSHYSPEANKCIIQALSMIENNINSPITANDISEQVNMSRSYFSKCFKDIVGQTFNEYVRFVRIHKAKHYLQNTNDRIGVISEKVGYIDVKYFSKIFRLETGLLPSDYRKIKQGS